MSGSAVGFCLCCRSLFSPLEGVAARVFPGVRRGCGESSSSGAFKASASVPRRLIFSSSEVGFFVLDLLFLTDYSLFFLRIAMFTADGDFLCSFTQHSAETFNLQRPFGYNLVCVPCFSSFFSAFWLFFWASTQ